MMRVRFWIAKKMANHHIKKAGKWIDVIVRINRRLDDVIAALDEMQEEIK